MYDLVVTEALIAGRSGVFHRICAVHTVNLGRFDHQVGVNLDRAKARSRIGCKEWISGTRSEHYDPFLFQMANRATAEIILTHGRV